MRVLFAHMLYIYQMRKRLQRLVIICLIGFGTKPCISQEYIFNHLSTRDGLASNNILSLYQDPTGYLWVGTENGLQRYDGYHFTTPAASILKQPVQQILADKDGTMWIRMGKTIGIFDPARFEFREVVIDKQLATADVQFFELRTDAKKNLFLLVKRTGVFFPDNDKKTIRPSNDLFSVPAEQKILSVTDDAMNNRYWINTVQGLGYYDKKTRRFYAHGKDPANHILINDPRFSSSIANFYIDVQRRFWIERWVDGTGKREYYCYDEKKNRFNADTAGMGNSGNSGYYEIRGLREFNDTTVMLYGLNCMSMRENGRFTKFLYPQPSPYSIQFNVVSDVLEDREKILWVATDDGLYNTMPDRYTNLHLTLLQPLGRASINCLMQDDEKNIWIGTWGRGILLTDTLLQKKPDIITHDMISTDWAVGMIWAMLQHKASRKIWIGCQSGILFIYDPVSRTRKKISPTIFSHSTIRDIAEDSNGNLWFGLHNGALIMYDASKKIDDPKAFREVHRFGNFIPRLMTDKKGSLWISVGGKGISVMNVNTGVIEKTYTAGTNATSLSGNDIRDILPLNDSIYMLAGDNLEQLNIKSGAVKHISRYDNSPLGIVHSLQAGMVNECWVSTANGIFRYNVRTGNLIHYSQWDGLISVFNTSFITDKSTRLHNNKLVFGGNQNLVLFDPAHYKTEGAPPDVQITGFELLGNYLPVDSITRLKALRLDPMQNSFTIDFASLSFIQLEKITYEYKLEGADNDWITVKLPQPVKYALLPPGKYTFMVRSRNSEGIYAVNTTLLTIVVLPPFWKTYWFFALLGLIIASFLFYLHRLRLKRLLQVEKVRSKLARDLHDDMGSALSTINILSNMAMQLPELDDATGKNFMGKISENTSRMMESMDDIIWSINPSNDSMGKVLARMKQVAGNVLEPHGIEYRFYAEELVKELSFTMETRREIFLIYKEAINNIIKYAHCTKVDVTMRKQTQYFLLIITDNGVGFDLANRGTFSPTRGNGIINMQKRSENMKGTLDIDTSPGEGTCITLRIPLA